MLNQAGRIRRRLFLPIFNMLLSRKTNLWGTKRFILRLACIDCRKGSKCVGPITISHAAELCVGEDSWLGMDFKVYGSGTVTIGRNCDIGPDVTVLSGSHEIGSYERRAGRGFHYTTEIGNGCWIGGRATLYGNIKIDDASIVAAGAVVNKNVASNSIVGGVPARLLRKI